MTERKGGRIAKAGKSQKNPLFPHLGVLQEDQAIYHNVCAEWLGQCNAGSLIVCSVTCEPLWAKVSCFCKFSPGVLDTPGSYNLFSHFFAGLSKLLMFVCESASILSVIQWHLSDDKWHRHQSSLRMIIL